MGHRSQICDHANTNAQRLDCTNCSFPTRTRALYEHFYFLKTHLLSSLHGLLGCHSCSKWGALARSFETSRPGTAPANRIALQIRDGHDGVIEGRKDVHLSCRNLAFDLTRSGRSPRCTCLFCHNSSSLNLYMSVTAVLQVAAGEKGNPIPSLLVSSLLFLGRSTTASATSDCALGTLACAGVRAGILTTQRQVAAVA